MRSTLPVIVALAGLLAVIGCGGDKPIASGMKAEFEDAPDWVIKGCAAYEGEKKAVICGVGSATGTRNVSLARTAAMGRARTDIARTLQVKVKAMLKDYQATTTGGEDFGKAASDEQHIVDVSKQVTNSTLSGTELRDSWISNTGTLWVLMVLDLEKFSAMVNGIKALPERLRKAIVERAEKEFESLDEEIDKLEGK